MHEEGWSEYLNFYTHFWVVLDILLGVLKV